MPPPEDSDSSPVTVTDRKLLQMAQPSFPQKADYPKISSAFILETVADLKEVEQALNEPGLQIKRMNRSSSLSNLDCVSPKATAAAALTLERLEHLNRLRLELQQLKSAKTTDAKETKGSLLLQEESCELPTLTKMSKTVSKKKTAKKKSTKR